MEEDDNKVIDMHEWKMKKFFEHFPIPLSDEFPHQISMDLRCSCKECDEGNDATIRTFYVEVVDLGARFQTSDLQDQNKD